MSWKTALDDNARIWHEQIKPNEPTPEQGMIYNLSLALRDHAEETESALRAIQQLLAQIQSRLRAS